MPCWSEQNVNIYPQTDAGILQMYDDLSASDIFPSVTHCYVPGKGGSGIRSRGQADGVRPRTPACAAYCSDRPWRRRCRPASSAGEEQADPRPCSGHPCRWRHRSCTMFLPTMRSGPRPLCSRSPTSSTKRRRVNSPSTASVRLRRPGHYGETVIFRGRPRL